MTDSQETANDEPSSIVPEPEQPESLWSSLKQAIRGDHQQDYTDGPLGRAQGVFLAITIAFSMLAVFSVFIFRRGRWKTKRV